MNRDLKTIEGFGEEWDHFDQSHLEAQEHLDLFKKYFSIFPWQRLPQDPVGFDLGCGSGRWAKLVAPHVKKLHCIDPAEKALNVAKKMLSHAKNVEFHLASVDDFPLKENSMDFGYSLGVLHHIPDTLAGLQSCVAKLKPGAPFLVYLYYALENRPWWFKALFKASHLLRLLISALPWRIKKITCFGIALVIYFPWARLAYVSEKCGFDVRHFPLTFYRNKSFYVMKTDALDRFGTRLEKRFTRPQIQTLLEQAGLEDIIFREQEPFWCAVGTKKLLNK